MVPFMFSPAGTPTPKAYVSAISVQLLCELKFWTPTVPFGLSRSFAHIVTLFEQGDPAFQWDYVVSTAGNQNGLLTSPCLPSPSSMLISPTALNRLTTMSPSASDGVAGDMLNQDYMAQFTAEFAWNVIDICDMCTHIRCRVPSQFDFSKDLDLGIWSRLLL